MVERVSALDGTLRPGSYGNAAKDPGVMLSEITPAAIAEVAAWPGESARLLRALRGATGLALSIEPNAGALKAGRSAFCIGPGRYLVTGGQGLVAGLEAAIPLEIGTVTDLSHGRTGIRIAGPRAEWVLAKLFAVNLSADTFPPGEGRATAHHDIFVHMQRSGEDRFDLYAFRSLARALWHALCDAAGDVGYEIR